MADANQTAMPFDSQHAQQAYQILLTLVSDAQAWHLNVGMRAAVLRELLLIVSMCRQSRQLHGLFMMLQLLQDKRHVLLQSVVSQLTLSCADI